MSEIICPITGIHCVRENCISNANECVSHLDTLVSIIGAFANPKSNISSKGLSVNLASNTPRNLIRVVSINFDLPVENVEKYVQEKLTKEGFEVKNEHRIIPFYLPEE